MLTAWIIAGAVLIVLELVVPGMVLVFLGAGALLVALLIWLGLIQTWVASITAWFIASLVLLLVLRGFFQRFMSGDSERQITDEKQMEAEREKRAEITRASAEKEATVNISQGERQEEINLSEGEKQRRINVAKGRAEAISILAEATAAATPLSYRRTRAGPPPRSRRS